MSDLWVALARIMRDLDSERAQWAVVGGIAAGARTEPRFTKDLDIAVAVADDRDAEQLVNSLLGRGYRVLAVLEQEPTGRLATVRLVAPGATAGGAVLDLLFATCGIEREIVAAAQRTALTRDITAPTARIGHLLAMKLLSVPPQRPQDQVDLIRLTAAAVAGPDELDLARSAAALIESRGYARGRRLMADLDTFLTKVARGEWPVTDTG